MTFQNDTEPRMPRVSGYRNDLQAPPRILFYGVLGFFVLVILGIIGAIFVFTQVLQPSQQQRVIDAAPFMRSFLPPTPQGGVLPTIEPDDAENDAALDLLNQPLVFDTPTADVSDGVATAVPTTEPTAEEVAVTPTEVPPTPTFTPVPPTATEAAAAINTPSQSIINTSLSQNLSSLPSSARLYGMRWERQEWNNCGPSTVTTALTFYGWQNDQNYAKERLKPNREDKNVSPQELVDFVNEYTDLRAAVRIGGSINTLRALLANEYPVMIERGMQFEANDWLGHYQALVAYDDTSQLFFAYDSFMGTGEDGVGVYESYSSVDEDWRAFNRLFIVIYPPQEEARVMEILGPLADADQAAEIAFATAQEEATTNPEDGFAWFNMGTSLVQLGRYEEAANAYAQARRYTLPWRMFWYQFGPFKAFFESGRYEEVLVQAQTILSQAEELEEAYYWRGRVYEARGEIAQAQVQYRQALSYNSNFDAARTALEQIQ
ncbi:MAG: tetratricopeptide repeat protein [Anaerolineae bacterium]|nr:tetratricopeptide repeat protein [Anaerolineae bacterium]